MMKFESLFATRMSLTNACRLLAYQRGYYEQSFRIPQLLMAPHEVDEGIRNVNQKDNQLLLTAHR